MENIWKETIEAVQKGCKWNINLQKRNLYVNKKAIIKGGEYKGNLGIEPGFVLENIEKFYERYKHSVPSERSDNKRRTYFRALKEKDLSDADMCYGEEREVAQCKLELYILICIIMDRFPWTDDMGKWFWQSQKDKDLVILKDWVVTDTTTNK